MSLLAGSTPIQRLRRVEAVLDLSLDGARVYVKRDDVIPLGVAA